MVLAWWLNYPIKYPSADRTQHSNLRCHINGFSNRATHCKVSLAVPFLIKVGISRSLWISKLRSVKFEFLGLRFADAELFESDIRQNLSENYLVE